MSAEVHQLTSEPTKRTPTPVYIYVYGSHKKTSATLLKLSHRILILVAMRKDQIIGKGFKYYWHTDELASALFFQYNGTHCK